MQDSQPIKIYSRSQQRQQDMREIKTTAKRRQLANWGKLFKVAAGGFVIPATVQDVDTAPAEARFFAHH